MPGKLNVKVAVVLLAGIVVVSAGWYLLHRFQTNRLRDVYRVRADAAESEGRSDRAARLLNQYLTLAPEDTESLVRYAFLMDKLASDTRGRRDALATFQQVLIRDPGQADVRRRAVALAIQVGRFEVALSHLNVLHEQLPDDPELELLRAGCLSEVGGPEEAAEAYRSVIQRFPDQVDAYARLADLLRSRLNQHSQAEALLDEAVRANPSRARAHLARALFRRSISPAAGREQVGRDLERARVLGPDDVDALVTSAQFAVEDSGADPGKARQALQDARQYLKAAIDRAPAESRLYEALAGVEYQDGKVSEALACLREGTKRVPGRSQHHLLWHLADLLIKSDGQAEAREVIQRLKNGRRLPPARCQFLEGRVLAAEGKWHQASLLLEEVRPLLADSQIDSKDLMLQADLLLGYCFQHLGDPDRQLAVYRRAAQLDPLHPAVRSGLASALSGLGRLDEAVREYKQVTTLERPPFRVLVHLARLMILRNLGGDAKRANWDEVDGVLEAAGRSDPDSAEVTVLKAEALAGRGNVDKARLLLEEGRSRRPKEVELWVALAGLAVKEGKREDAIKVLDEAWEQLGDSADLRLARLRFLPPKAEEALGVVARLEDNVGRFEVPQQVLLLRGLANAHLQLGQPKAGRALLERVADLQPGDLQTRLVLFDLAQQVNDEAAIGLHLKEIQRIEGPGGPLGHFGEASRLIRNARKGDRSKLAEARSHLATVSARRPGWARVPLALAAIDEQEESWDRAIDNYKKALELGDRHYHVVRRLATLLFERQRYAEADAAIRRLQEQAPISNELTKLAAEISARNLDPERALQLAQQAVLAESADYRDHLWLGQLFWAVGKKKEAETELLRAAEVAKAPQPWVVLVQYYVRVGEVKKAEETIERARRALQGDGVSFVMGQCYEALGRREKAEEEYGKALKAHPDDLQSLQGVATFYQKSGSAKKAEPLLRRMLDPGLKAPPASVSWARRNLAVCLGSGGDESGFREATALLDANASESADWDEDLRARAVIFAAHPGHEAEAITLLERAAKRQPPSPDQEFLLARLYEREGNWTRARERMLKLIGTRAESPHRATHIAAFVGSLLRRGEVAEAEIWLRQLESLQPRAFSTLAHRARVSAENGRTNEMVRAAKSYGDDKDASPVERPARFRQSAVLLEGLAQEFPGVRDQAVRVAEEMYRTYAAEAKEPEKLLVLAGFLGRQGRVADGLDLCEKARADCPLQEVAVAAVTVVTSGPASPRDFEKVEDLLGGASQAHPARLLLPYLGALRDWQGRHAEAEKLFRQALDQDRNNITSLNNLANLLALQQGKGREAQEFIHRAVDRAGLHPELADTRALAHLAEGNPEAALKDVQRALADKRTPGRLLHLARVHTVAGNKSEAKKALSEAIKLGIKEDALHPLERPVFRGLVAECGLQ